MASNRAETGPMQFGEDWPGVFIRGDNAFGFVMTLRKVLETLPADSFGDKLTRAVLTELTEYFEGSHVESAVSKQALAPFAECQSEAVTAAREMREVLALCLPCLDEEIHDPRTTMDRRDSVTVLRGRLVRLIGEK